MSIQEFDKQMERQFKINRENITFSLRGDAKYFDAEQCKTFENNIKVNGWHRIKGKDIKHLRFEKYSINLIKENGAYITMERFSNTDQLKGFVKGYNASVFMQTRKAWA